MGRVKEYKKMTEGRGHFWERPSLISAMAGTLFLSLIFAVVIAGFTGITSHPIGFGPVFLFFVLVFGAFFIYSRIGNSPAQQVSEVMVATPSREIYGNPKKDTDDTYRLAKIKPFVVRLSDYVHGKGNRNVLVTGSSGQGKSKLTRYLLDQMNYQKIIFSFKPQEEYLKANYISKDISKTLPSPFQDKEAFINAFAVAFPMSSVGIQASMIPTTLDAVLKQSNNWSDFEKILQKEIKSSHDQNKRSALLFIEANTKRLKYNTGNFEVGKDTLVLDFSRLNEDSKSFYAELTLRQLYHDMEKQHRKDMLICVDEAHRLTTGEFGRYHTILVEMAREIRDKGMLWITTQNYTDIPDGLRNQFATQFLFKTTSQGDLTALRSIEPLLS